MAWSYRQDLSDELYSKNTGVTQVEGEKIPETPRSAAHVEEMVKGEKEKVDKDARITEHQEFPGQNVPRFVKESDEEKKAREEKQKTEGRALVADPKESAPAEDAAKAQRLNADRDRIRTEEQQKAASEEHEKELEKIRKEEADKVKKENKEPAHSTGAKK